MSEGRQDDDQPVRVFISYSHDSEEHRQRVLKLAQRLRGDGVDAVIDQFEPHPAEGWPLWMERQLEQADFVLVVCTEAYHRRYRGEEESGVGRGVTWESVLARQDLYEAQARNEKFIPVLFSGAVEQNVPKVLRAHTRYSLPDAYESVLRHVMGQPAVVAAPLGEPRRLDPTEHDNSRSATPLTAPAAHRPSVTNRDVVAEQLWDGIYREFPHIDWDRDSD